MKLSSSPIIHHKIHNRLCIICKPTPQKVPFQHSTKLTTQRGSSNVKILNISVNYDLFLQNSKHLASNPFSSSSSSWDFSKAPAVSLGSRWMDIQGVKNWEGLLDPLDNNLRGEIIRYGHFVEAAYRTCDFEPSSPSYGKCKYSKKKLLVQSGFPETGYRVIKNLRATSGIVLPRLFEKAPHWMSMRSSWIGYIAVCHDKRVIAKLGRRDVVIALRGTITCLEWLENLRATLTPLPNDNCGRCGGLEFDSYQSIPMVESGFLSLYTSRMEASAQSLQDSLRGEIGKILETYGHEPLSFTITGHSLGAALATLAAYDIKETFKCEHLVTVISFGGPRVGNHSFRCLLEEQGTKILRIVNSDDLITKVPGFVIDNNEDNNDDDDDVGLEKYNELLKMGSNDLFSWIQKVVVDCQCYADVGCELRLSSSDSPYLNGRDLVTCHELKTYLHLVNVFVSSNCPVRAAARRIINQSLAQPN